MNRPRMSRVWRSLNLQMQVGAHHPDHDPEQAPDSVKSAQDHASKHEPRRAVAIQSTIQSRFGAWFELRQHVT